MNTETHDIHTNADSGAATVAADGFSALGISGHLLKSTLAAGFADPKPIQRKAIPPFLAGRDVLGIAQTGSGKTAAFALPILSKIVALGTKRRPRTTRALVLVPTRELAVQIDDTIRLLAKGAHVSTALVLGGVSRHSQVRKIAPGVDIVIATPGRLLDLLKANDVVLSDTSILILDEADRMLDMGFINDVRRIAKATHAARQTGLFSATMPDEIEKLAETLMREPVRISVSRQGTTAAEISQGIVMARLRQKRQILARLLGDPGMGQVLVFARTKHGADRVARDLGRDGFAAGVIHGNKSQNARQSALNGFRDGSLRILVATDIAARGIDVPGISHVVNFDLPDEPESYVHRIGRTGRNGMSGIAITLCDPAERPKLHAVEKVIRIKLPILANHLADPDPAPVPGESRNTERAVDPRSHRRKEVGVAGKPGGNASGGRGKRPAGHSPAIEAALQGLPERRRPSAPGIRSIAESKTRPTGQPAAHADRDRNVPGQTADKPAAQSFKEKRRSRRGRKQRGWKSGGRRAA